MSTILRRPKAVLLLFVAGLICVTSLAGGALGHAFGMGFLGSPLPAIQLPAEAITSGPTLAGFTVTNTMVASWAAAMVLLLVSFLSTHSMSSVPGRLQSLIEVLIEFFLDLCSSVAGRDKARKFFPLVMTIFLFVVVANWMGILPGFGTIGRVESVDEIKSHHTHSSTDHDAHSEADWRHTKKIQVFSEAGGLALLPPNSMDSEMTVSQYDNHEVPIEEGKRVGVLVPFLRSANTDVNTTLGIALIAMIMVHGWGFQTLGLTAHMSKFVNFKGGPIGMFVGILEAISEIARVISFTFRLFGNVFAGEVLLVAIAFLLPVVGIIPFLGLELFVGLIQAFIFSMLTLVFATMATISHGNEKH